MPKPQIAGSEDGYTLTEMLVVLVIIGLLAAALTPLLAGQVGRARAKAARLQVQGVATSVEAFRSDVGRFPTLQEGLGVLREQPKDAEGWLGPYVKSPKGLLDPWGKPLVYTLQANGEPQVTSLGADGKAGGQGQAADINAE